mgnify:FL=1
MLSDGVIEPSTSPYVSPIIILTKKDGKYRFCVDYRRLNAITDDAASSMPNIPDTLRDLGQAKVFSTIDLRSGYWQIPLTDRAKPLTAFSTPDGAHYQFRVMPFGLNNAPATFQRLMVQEVLVGYLRKFAIAYLDDIIVYSDNPEQHLEHLRQVFGRLASHGLRCAPEKCHFGSTEIEYLGHVVTAENNQPKPKHLHQIRLTQPPKSRSELRSFLGLCNWVRDFVPRFAETSAPLTDLLAIRGGAGPARRLKPSTN